MPRIVLLVFALLAVRNVAAESRGILLEVTSLRAVRPELNEYSAPRVTIYSDEKTERRRDASIGEAAGILRVARDWGSIVYVEILYHQRFIRAADLIMLLDGMKDNPGLNILRVEDADSDIGKKELERFKDLGPK